MDVKSGYSHPIIKEESYIEQLQGFRKLGKIGKKTCLQIEHLNVRSITSRKKKLEELANFFIRQNFTWSKNNNYFCSKNQNDQSLYDPNWVHHLVTAGNKDIVEFKKTLEGKFKTDNR